MSAVQSPARGIITYPKWGNPSNLTTSKHYYQLVEKLGEGADGVVWKAVMDGKENVAVKMVPIVTARGTKMQSFVENEFRLFNLLKHENIVKLQGDGLIQTRHYFFTVMEWIDGKTLEAYREEIVKKTGHDPTDEIAQPLFSQMAAALKHVHDQHIVHLDLSLANFLIVDNKKIVLVDFGDGKFFADEKASLLTGVLSKSYGLLPPETLEWVHNSSASPWSAYAADWWNLGVLIYDFLQGRHPFYTPEEYLLRKETILFPSDCKLPKDKKRYVKNQLVLKGLESYLKLDSESLTFTKSVSHKTRTFIGRLLSLKPEARRPL